MSASSHASPSVRARRGAAASTSRPQLPRDGRAPAEVRFLAHGGLPDDIHGIATAAERGYLVWMNLEKVKGLADNDREAWLTFFHEIAHVLFGDVDRDPRDEAELEAREARAEGFAEFMLGAINDALTMSIGAHAKPAIEHAARELGAEWQLAQWEARGNRGGARWAELSEADKEAVIDIAGETPNFARGLREQLAARIARGPEQAFVAFEGGRPGGAP